MAITISGDTPNFSAATITTGTVTTLTSTTGTVTTLTAPTSTITTLNAPSGVLATQNGMTGIAKAWVNFNGTGTVAIVGSFNVSSITDNGTGDYTINFTTAFANTNYARTGWGNWPNSSAAGLVSGSESDSKTTTSCRIRTVRSSDFSPTDLSEIGLAIFSS
jgi:hypothetical protein